MTAFGLRGPVGRLLRSPKHGAARFLVAVLLIESHAGVAVSSNILAANVSDASGGRAVAAASTPTVGAASALAPADVGQWSAPLSWPLVAVHMTMLANRKVLVWDDHTSGVGADVFDPATNAMTAVPFDIANLFCSGHALLPDGRVFVAGGHTGTIHSGIADSSIFDPATQTWSSGARMSVGRWYPTVTALPDGRMLVTAGEINCDGCNALTPEIYNPATNSWTQLTGATQDFPYYPHMFVLPDGRVFASSSNRKAIASMVLDLATKTWSVVDPAVLDGGSAASYAPGKIIKTGLGRDPDAPPAPSVATTYVIDMN
jgi:hypothetical protein